MSQEKGGKPGPVAQEQQPEPILPEQLFAAHTKKQIHPKAARAVAAGLIYVMGEILNGAYALRVAADADEAGAKEIQPRQVDDAIRSDTELRRLLSAWLLERAPATRSGPQPVQQSVANTPDGALEESIDRMMRTINPDETVTLGVSAKSTLAGLLALLMEKVMDAADVISTRTSSNVIYTEDVRAAVKVMLMGEMRQLADREIRSATA
ncbi:hypothetical protein AB0N56_34660 [Streptomyces microflavus]|uniref:hypothetical protein n=1 Tax=Streptomyces microflavus TaxID=1919 RepID=UPI00343CA0AA